MSSIETKNWEKNLDGDLTRFAFLPIKYEKLKEYYDEQKRVFWTAEEISYKTDRADWDKLGKEDPNAQEYIKFLLYLFAQLDGIVNENLMKNFEEETSFIKEAGFFYAIQKAVEVTHNETYSMLIKSFVRDLDEQLRGLNSIKHFPEIRKIAEWCWKWMDRARPLPERIIAFACIEGIIFSSAFAGIYWIKRRNILAGLTKANEWIARDEGIHTKFAVALYHTIMDIIKHFDDLDMPMKLAIVNIREHFLELTSEKVHAIISSAVETTAAFTRGAMRCDLVGLDAERMIQYVQCTADNLATSFGFPAIYNVSNPFDWMVIIGLPNKTNFFEGKVSEYSRPEKSDDIFDLNTPH